MFNLDEIKKQSVDKINKTQEAFAKDLATVRTGRANANIINNISVDYYGTPTPITSLVSTNIPTARRIDLSVYDKSMILPIEKSIIQANIGITPQVDGNIIKLNIPDLNEEVRKDLVKKAEQFAEKSKIAVRNTRREFMKELDDAKKGGDIPEDDYTLAVKSFEEEIKKHIEMIDKTLKSKSQEIMKV